MTDNSSIDLSLTKTWQAWTAFRKGKKPSREIILFESELERNLLLLCSDLNNGSYKHSGYSHRIVNEKKRRDITVAGVRDRVVHRLLYDYLVPLVDTKLDYDVWSCRKNKGLHQALVRTKRLSGKFAHGWVWRADVSKFFDNVNHQILKNCLQRYVSDNRALHLLDRVIESYSLQLDERKGIPIGNLTSQIFANIYLNEFDHFVRHEIKPHGYLRYGDDFVLYMNSQREVEQARELVTTWLSDKLHLKIHPKNNVIVRTSQGLQFLGHQIYPSSSISIDKAMSSKIGEKLDRQNAGSYKATNLTAKQEKHFPWLLKERI